jgi:predicted nucleic acid-binding protein
MIVLDTNVLSEEMRTAPEPKVHAWLQAKHPASLFTTAVTEAELLYGVAVLPDGKRKTELMAAAQRIMALFAGRVLPFDSAAAAELATILVARKRLGRPIASYDAQIVAIARSRGMSVATRDVGDFADCGVALINPWK